MAIRNVVTRGFGSGATIPFVVTRGYSISTFVQVSAVIGGTTAYTQLLVKQGQSNTITLTNDTWVTGSAFNQIQQLLIDAFTSAQTEATGWNREVRDKALVTSVVRTTNTVVTINWQAAPDYEIIANEAIAVLVPDEALVTSTSPVLATPTVGITAPAAVAMAHTVSFSSVSRSAKFASVSRSATFASVSNTRAIIRNTPDPLAFILTEDGDNIVQENGTLNIAKE